MLPEMKFSPAEVIALLALLVAVLSAVYSRGAQNAARRANEISIRESRRPLRLQVFQAMHHFSHYCATYWTVYHLGQVRRSRELTARIDTFKWELAQHGHLDMPDADEKAKQFILNAWKMQRLVDRIDGGHNCRHDPQYATGEENIEGLVDWFGGENRELKRLFESYLSAA